MGSREKREEKIKLIGILGNVKIGLVQYYAELSWQRKTFFFVSSSPSFSPAIRKKYKRAKLLRKF